MRKPKWILHYTGKSKFRLIPHIRKTPLLWKDKFDTPRCEHVPTIEFSWLWFSIYAYQESDEYWEQWLWIHKYNDGDYDKAKETWGWIDYDTKESTWEDYK